MVQQSPKSTPSRRTPSRGPKAAKQCWVKCDACGVRTMTNHECDTVGPIIGNSAVKLMCMYKDTVYCHLHPDTMKEIGIKIGSFVRINSDVLECWPDPTILLDHVGCSSEDRSLVSLLMLEAIRNATQVYVVINGRIDKTYLPFVLQNKVVFCGQKISVPYFSKAISITIDSVSASEPEPKCNGAVDDAVELITIELSNSSITENYYQILATTVFIEKDELFELPKMIGMDKITQKIQNILDHSLESPQTFGCMGPPRTLLVTGPSGSGKSLLCRTIIQANINYNSSIVHDFSKTIALEEQTKIILLDGLDSVRDDDNNKIENIVTFIKTMPKNVFALATSSYIPSALKKHFPLQVQMPSITSEMRSQIFRFFLEGCCDSLSAADIEMVSSKAHGYVGADICNVCRQALLLAESEPLTVVQLLTALTKVPPGSMNDIKIEVPEVRWSDIGGLKDVQQLLTQVISWPIIHNERYQEMGITPPKGVLMYGPPGCCKTMMAKALATESGLNFLSVKGPELLSMYVGESERAIRELFAKSRTAAPAIVFFDEIDALASHRGADRGSGVHDRVLAQLLTELDGVEGLTGVVVVAATNRPDRIDKALLRPGRLEKLVYIPLPDFLCRQEIFQLKFSRIPHQDLDFEECARQTAGFSGAEVVAVCHAAAIESINCGVVTPHLVSQVITSRLPQTTESSLQLYEDFSRNKI